MLDYIIVGYGLAGAAITFRLEKKHREFLVFEDNSQQSSKVAAGLMNPVILKRFTLAWNADKYLEKATSFYKDVETHLQTSFLEPVEIYRKFFSVEEQNNWFAATDNVKTAPFLDTVLHPEINKGISAEYSFGRVLKTSKLDTKTYLHVSKGKLLQKGKLRQEKFDYESLLISEGGVEYKGIKAKNIIFCEGFGIQKNPFFNYLPVPGNKGEYIIIKSPQLQLTSAIKSSVFIIPVGDDLYKVGATYNNHDKVPGPTMQAGEELLKKLDAMISVPYEVVGQISGIRPSTGDRRPLAGRHPEYGSLYCCNGFGSRGVILAPAISEELLDFIEDDKALPPETDIFRFAKRWKIRN